MIFRFDLARLDCFQRESLLKILDVIQLGNVGEIVVCAVELPYKFLVLVDNGVVSLKGSVCMKRDCPVCQNLNPDRSHGQLPKRIRKIIRKQGRRRNRNHRMPVRAARFALDGRLQR